MSIPTGELSDCVTKQYVYLYVTRLRLYLVEIIVVLVQVTFIDILHFSFLSSWLDTSRDSSYSLDRTQTLRVK